MHPYAKWLRNIPGELTLLGAAILALAPAFPRAAFFGAFAWSVGLLFYNICKIGSFKALSSVFHLNLVVVGTGLAFDRDWSLTLTAGIAIAAVATTLVTSLMSRLLYFHWIPALILPALVVLGAARGIGTEHVAEALLSSSWQRSYALAIFSILSVAISPFFFGMFVGGVGIGSLMQFASYGDFWHSAELSVVQGLTFAFCASIYAMPSKRSMAWATLAVSILSASAAIDVSLFGHLDLFHLICWANVGSVASIYGSRMFSRYTYASWRSRPEDKLEDKMTQWQRFRAGEPRVGMPFNGTWNVSQSFDGAWTHRGIWQHGLDFNVLDQQGKSFAGDGYELSDYYAFGKEVLAPTSGYVVALFQEFPDNPVGAVKNQNNFGNYVIIRDAYGAHVLLGHLKQGSVTCSLYQYVEANQVIGLCGNSGYSPEPHIHMHVQVDAVVGSATIPFHVSNYLANEQFHFHGVPQAQTVVTKLDINHGLSRSLAFRVDESFSIVSKDPKQSEETSIENRLDPHWGSMYFTDGQAKLFHYRDPLTFYFYRYEGPKKGPLFDLMTALPRVPLIYGVKCSYEDMPPVVRWQSSWQRFGSLFALIFSETSMNIKTSFTMNCDVLEITGVVGAGDDRLKTVCILDPIEGLGEFTVGERKYEVRSLREHRIDFGANIDVRSAG